MFNNDLNELSHSNTKTLNLKTEALLVVKTEYEYEEDSTTAGELWWIQVWVQIFLVCQDSLNRIMKKWHSKSMKHA